jgi:hypothetical protein
MTEPSKKHRREGTAETPPESDSDEPSGPQTDGTAVVMKQMLPNPPPEPGDPTGPESEGGTNVERVQMTKRAKASVVNRD